MTTTIIKSIGTNGRDCATLQAFFDLIPMDLVAANQQWVGEVAIEGVALCTTRQALTGNRVTDATRNIILRPAAGAGFADHVNRDINPVAVNASKGAALLANLEYVDFIYIENADYTVFTGLQVKNSSPGAPLNLLYLGGIAAKIEKNIFHSVNGTGVLTTHSMVEFNSNVVITESTNNKCGMSFNYGSGGIANFNTVYAKNGSPNSAIRCEPNGQVYPLCKNNASFGFVNAFTYCHASSVNNATDQATVKAGIGLVNLAFVNQFVSVTDLRTKAGSALIGAGVAVAGQTTDMFNRARSTPPSIGADEYFAPVDATAPVMTGAITVSAITTTGFTLAWPAATDDVAVTGYEYSVNNGTTYTSVGNVLTVNVTGVASSTLYNVMVRAFDAASNKATPLSTTATTTTPPDVTLPVLTGVITATNVTAIGFDIAWPAGSDNIAVAGYEVSKDGGTNWIVLGNVLTYSFAGLTNGVTYPIRVRAFDAANNKSTPALALSVSTLDTTAPVLTGVITSSAITNTGFTLSWSAGTDNVGVAGYEYSANGGLGWTDVGNVLTITLTSMAVGTTYQTQVRAYDLAGNRSNPPLALAVQTTGTVADSTAPNISGAITPSNITSNAFDIAWPAATDNVAAVNYSYSIDGGVNWQSVGNVFSTHVSNLTPSTGYAVRVRARDEAGNLTPTPLAVTVTTSAPVDVVVPQMTGSLSSSLVTVGGFTLTWVAATDAVGVVGYEVSTDGGSSYVAIGNVLTYAVTGLAAATQYQVRVRAFDAANNKANPLAAAVTTSTPIDSTVPSMSGSITTSVVANTSFTMSWPAGADNVAVASYEVSTDGGSTWSNVGNVLTTSVVGRVANTQYQLRVRAKDAAANVSAALAAIVTTTNMVAGTITTLPISNGQDQILLSTPVTFYLRNEQTGVIISKVVTTHATTGVAVIADASVFAGVAYWVIPLLADGALGIERYAAV